MTATQLRDRIIAHAGMVASVGQLMTDPDLSAARLGELVRSLNYHLLHLRRLQRRLT